MRVLVISSMYPKPGDEISGNFIHRQVLELSKMGVEMRVICPLARWIGKGHFFSHSLRLAGMQTLKIDDIPVAYVPYWNFPLRLSARMETALQFYAISGFIKEKSNRTWVDCDLIHAHRLFPTGYVALQIARQLRIPIVCSARGSDVHTHPLRNVLVAKLTRETIVSSNQITAVSRELAQRIDQLARPSVPVKVVYNGVDTDIFRPLGEKPVLRKQLGLPMEGIGLCTVSRLVADKGLRELVEAFRTVHSHYPSMWLVIVGDGPIRPELEDWVREQKLEGRIFISGSRSHIEVVSWINAADIFVLASYAEGLPNAVLEAMACRKPVIATDVGGIPEVAINNETALLVSPRQVPPLADAIGRLIQDSELRDRLGMAGNKRVKTHFTWSRSAMQLVKIYSETMHRATLKQSNNIFSAF